MTRAEEDEHERDKHEPDKQAPDELDRTNTSGTSTRTSEEIGMSKVVRARMRALVGALRGLCGGRKDAGMVTSEYAVGIVAAAGFALVLYKVVTSGQVSAELHSIVKRALDAGM